MMNEEIPTSKRLTLAFAKLKRNNAREGKPAPNISDVAREAGFSPTLIHTKYSDLAREINQGSGRGREQQLMKQLTLVKQAENRSAELRSEVAALKIQNKGFASENARLILSIKTLEKKVFALESGAAVLRPKQSSNN